MSRSTVVLFLSLPVCIGTLAWGYAESGMYWPVWALAGAGLVWAFCLIRRWYLAAGVGLLAVVACAGTGIWLEFSPGWMIAGVTAGLVNWDLAAFLNRQRAMPEQDVRLLERGHLARLAILTLAGLLLASAAMLVRLRFTFGWVVFLVLAAAWGVSQLVSWLRRGPE